MFQEELHISTHTQFEFWRKNMEEDEEEPGAGWADLPVELLELVFQRLEPPELLGVVPLVCRSWLEASRSPACWRNVCARVDASGWGQSSLQLTDFWTIVRRAPALKRLDISPAAGGSWRKKQLLEGVSEVAFFSVSDPWFSGEVLAQLVAKYDRSLRGLYLNSLLLSSQGDWDLVAEVARLSGLRDLRIVDAAVVDDKRHRPYYGELGQGLPALTTFGWRSQDWELRIRPPGPSSRDALLLDVLLSKASQLTDVRAGHVMSEEVLAALSECRSLRTLHGVVAKDVPFVTRHMSLLQDVQFIIQGHQRKNEAAVEELIDFVRCQCPWAEGVRKLHIGAGDYLNIRGGREELLRALLETVVGRCPQLGSLQLVGDHWDEEALVSAVERLPRLTWLILNASGIAKAVQSRLSGQFPHWKVSRGDAEWPFDGLRIERGDPKL